MSNNVIVTIKANTSAFKAEMKNVNSTMKVTESNFKLLSTQAQLFGSKTDYLKAQQAQYTSTLAGLNSKYEVQAQRLEELTTTYGTLSAAMEENLAAQTELNAEKEAAIASYGLESEEVTVLDERIAALNEEYLVLEANMGKVSSSINKTTVAMNNTEIGIAKAKKGLVEVNSKLGTDKLDKFGAAMKGVSETSGEVASALMPAAIGFGVVGGASAKASIEFGNAIAKLSTIADTSQVPINQLRQGILNLSNQTGTSANEIAESAYQAISAGRSTADALNFVSTANKLAVGGFTSNAEAVHTLSIIMNAYGLKANQVNMVSNDLIRTQNLVITTVDQLGQTIGDVIPIAADAGVNLQQVAAGLVLLTKQGHDTAMSTTELKSLFNELSKSGSKSDKALRKLTGGGFEQLMEKGYSVSDVLKILNNYAKKNGQTLKDMFGNIRAGSGALTLMTDNGTAFNQTLKAMQKQGNDTNEAFNKMSQTAGFKLKKSLNELKNSGIEIGDSLAPVISQLTGALSGLAKWIQSLSPTQVKLATDIGLGVVAFTLFTKTLSSVTNAIYLVTDKLSGFIKKLILSYETNGIVAKSLNVLGGAFKSLWAFMLENPITLVIAAIAAIGVALYELYQHCATFRNEVNKMWAYIKNTFISFANYLKSVFQPLWNTIVSKLLPPLKSFAKFVIQTWVSVKTKFVNFIGYLESIFIPLWNNSIGVIVSVFDNVKTGITRAWSDITNIFNTVINFLKSIFLPIWQSIVQKLSGPFSKFVSIVSNNWNIVKNKFNEFINFIKSTFINTWINFIGNLITKFSDFKTSIFETWTNITNKFSGFINFIKSVFSVIWNDSIKGLVTTFSNFKNGVANTWNKVTSLFNNFITYIKTNFLATWNANIQIFLKVFNTIKIGISEAWSVITNIFNTFISWIKSFFVPLWTTLIKQLYKPFEDLKKSLVISLGTIQGIFNGFSSFLKNIFTKSVDSSVKSTNKSFNNLSKNSVGTWGAIKKAFSSGITFLKNTFGKLWTSTIKSLTKPLKDLVKSVTSLWNELKKVFNQFLDFLKNTFGKMWSSTIKALAPQLKDFCKTVKDAWIQIKSAFSSFIQFLSGIFAPLFDSKNKEMQEAMKVLGIVFKVVWDAIKVLLGAFLVFFGGSFLIGITTALTAIVTGVRIALGVITSIINGITGVLRGIIDFIKGVFTGNWSEAWHGVVEIFGSIFGTITGIVRTVFDSVKDVVMGIVNFIKDKLSFITNTVSNVKNAIKGAFSNVFVALPQHSLKATSIVKHSFATIPKPNGYASFASLNMNSLNELSGDVKQIGRLTSNQSEVINLELLADKIANKISKAITTADSNKIIQTSVLLDGKKIATATNKPLNKIQNQKSFILNRNGGI